MEIAMIVKCYLGAIFAFAIVATLVAVIVLVYIAIKLIQEDIDR